MVLSKKELIYTGAIAFLMVLFFGAVVLIAKREIQAFGSGATSKITIDLAKKRADSESLLAKIDEAKNENDIALPEEKNESADANQEAENQEKEALVFGIIGDTQYFKAGNSNGGFQKAIKNISARDPEIIFGIGDLVSSCDGKSECEAKLNAWKAAFGNLAGRVYAMQGNHDRIGKEKADEIWQKVFNFPTNGPAGFSELAYSFDKGNAHFVVLDSDKPDENIINSVQRTWLDQDLLRNKKENVFVFFHELAYPTNSKIKESLDAKPKERDALWEILSRHKVRAVFSGHEHIASRKKIGGVYQFVFGNTDSFNHLEPKPGTAEWSYVGQSFGMVKIEGGKVTVEAYSVDGRLLDAFVFPE